MNIILIGSAGSGKGTQARQLVKKFGMAYFSAGDQLRLLTRKNTPLGREVAKKISAGELISDEIMEKFLADFIDKNQNQSIIFDGFPRVLSQAEILKKRLANIGGVNLVIFLNISKQEAVKRLASRVICRQCGAVYNKNTNPPRQANICDRCGGKLYQREDETPKAIGKRLENFYEKTEPVIEFYRHQGVLEEVDGEKPIKAISAELIKIITLLDTEPN